MTIDFSKITLDKSRAFGTCHGEDTHGAAYEQDGLHFDAAGRLCTDDFLLPDSRRAEIERTIKERMVEDELRELRVQKLKALGILTEDAADAVDSDDADADAVKQIDLVAWAQGRLKLPWFSIAKAFEEQHGFKANSAATAIEFMVDEHLIAPDQIGIKIARA